jgi:Mitochondrial carrier protein
MCVHVSLPCVLTAAIGVPGKIEYKFVHHMATHTSLILSCALAKLLQVLCMYPTDVVKTRQQLGQGKTIGMIQQFRDIIKHEGFANLYRGEYAHLLKSAELITDARQATLCRLGSCAIIYVQCAPNAESGAAGHTCTQERCPLTLPPTPLCCPHCHAKSDCRHCVSHPGGGTQARDQVLVE